MKRLFTILALVVAGSTYAAEGYVTKTASGTTSAEVLFPAGSGPLRFTSVDVTSDKAASVLAFHVGTVGATVVKAAASTGTNVLFAKTTFNTNDSILLQNAAESITRRTVWGNVVTSTNKLINLQRNLGTNLAVGDSVVEVLPSAYTLLAPAGSSATAYLVDNVTSLAGSDGVMLDRGPAAIYTVDTIASTATNVRSYFTLKSKVQAAVTAGDAVYEQLTNKLVSFASTGGGVTNRLTLNTTNGVTINSVILHETAAGALTVYTVTNFTADTNCLVTPPVAEAAAVDDYVWVLHPTSYTAILPAFPGDWSMVLSAATSLASNDLVVVKSTGAYPWRTRLAATAVNTNIYTLTGNAGFLVAAKAGDKVYKYTNSFTTITAANNKDFAMVLNASTALSSGDRLLIAPVTGGLFENFVLGSPEDYAVTSVNFSAAIGVTLAVGDQAFLAGTTNTLPVGAATVRRDGASIYAVDRGRPVRVVLDGTSACAINALTGKYD